MVINACLTIGKKYAGYLVWLIVVLIISVQSVSAFSLKGMKQIESYTVPRNSFHGYISIVVDTPQPWAVVVPGQFAIEVIPWDTAKDETLRTPSTQYRLYVYSEKTRNYELRRDVRKVYDARFSALGLKQTADMISVSAPGGVTIFDSLTWADDLNTDKESNDGKFVPILPGSEIQVYAHRGARLKKSKSAFEEYPVPRLFNLDGFEPDIFHDVDDDNHTGYWKYLDRVTPERGSVQTGGRYLVAIVKDDDETAVDGALLIVYADGAVTNADMWERGFVKGKLVPTSFPGHYNLVWYDSKRNAIDMGESSAQFDGLNLLTLHFPLLKSQLRFERILPSVER